MIYSCAELEEKSVNRNIYIYGNGEYGGLVRDYLINKGLSFKGYCVSPEYKNKIEDIDFREVPMDAMILISVNSKLRNELISNVKMVRSDNFDVISDRLLIFLKRKSEHEFYFQTHITEHCNLNCRGCYHFSPLAKPSEVSPDRFEKDFSRLSYLLDGKAREVMLLGGEPLLHTRIDEIIKISRYYFRQAEIKILTNGILLHRMDASFYREMLDNSIQLWVTKYPVNYDYSNAEKYASSFGVELHYFNTEPVRTLGHQPLNLEGTEDPVMNFNNCYRANTCVDFKDGKLYPCIIPAEIKAFNDYFDTKLEVCDEDYVDIYAVNSAEELFDMLDRPMPFCRYCNREKIEEFGSMPWCRTEYRIEEWTQ